MSTSTNSPLEGLSIQAVATATGLSRATIYQAAEAAQLGAPAHFVWHKSAICYTLPGLCQLVQGLDDIGRQTEAKALAEVVRQLRQRAATAGRRTAPESERELARRWDLRAEQRQEEAAA